MLPHGYIGQSRRSCASSALPSGNQTFEPSTSGWRRLQVKLLSAEREKGYSGHEPDFAARIAERIERLAAAA